jgi:hypothetical protein
VPDSADLARLLVAIAAGDRGLATASLAAAPSLATGRRRRRGRANDHGSTPAGLARRATGRGGAGSPAAKAEQQTILGLLDLATA